MLFVYIILTVGAVGYGYILYKMAAEDLGMKFMAIIGACTFISLGGSNKNMNNI